MNPFCDNPKCQLHSHPADERRQVTIWQRDRKGNPYPVTRHVGYSLLRAGPKELRLCHVCSEAVKMAIAISTERKAYHHQAGETYPISGR